MHRLITVTDQMQFLIDTQTKPGTGKIERRSIHRRQTQNVPIKRHTDRDIGDVQCHVIELMNVQLDSWNGELATWN